MIDVQCSVLAMLSVPRLPPEVVAAAGVDHGVHGGVDPAQPGEDSEGELWVGDTVRADTSRERERVIIIILVSHYQQSRW